MDPRDRPGGRPGVIVVVALAWGAVAGAPFVALARRDLVTRRVRSFAIVARSRRRVSVPGSELAGPAVAAVMQVLRAPRRYRQARRRDEALRREVPVVVDLVGVAVAAGCTPFLAIEHAARYAPNRSAAALGEVSRACTLGRSLDETLRELGAAVAPLRPLAEALRTTARLGTPTASALGRLAAEVRADVRREAEARARTVPVRLCFPLVLCVLPAFALLTVAPAVFAGLHA